MKKQTNNKSVLHGPRWNKARMNVLNKKLFCKNNVFAPFCIMYKNKPPQKTRTKKKDANMNVQFDTCRTAHF